MTVVLALDLATSTGWARGPAGGEPEHGSLRFGKPGASDGAVFCGCLRWAYNFLREAPRADVLVIERLLPPEVVRGQTNTKTIYRLAGLHGIVIAAAHDHRIFRIETPSVGDIRGHFIDRKVCRRAQAKHEVMRKCRELGWAPQDDDAADALALWSYQCSIIDPRLALRVSPLFRKGVAL